MWGTRGRAAAAAVIAIACAWATPAQAADVRAPAARMATAPQVDGGPSFGEWPQTGPSGSGLQVRLGADADRLHVLVNGLDLPADEGSPTFTIVVDGNGDGRITAPFDQRFIARPDGTVERQRPGGPDSPPTILPTESSAAVRTDCFAADGTRGLAPGGGEIRCRRHPVAEFSISLAEVDLLPGGSLNIGVAAASGRSLVAFPQNEPGRLDDALVVAVPVLDVPEIPPAARLEIPLGPGMEVLQSTEGSLQVGLVAEKPTVVRVLPRVLDADDDRHPATVRLRAERNGQELPGSPLSQPLEVRRTPDRMTPADGATFVLPASWTQQGVLTLTARVTQLAGDPSPLALSTVFFVPTFKTSVWTVPLRTSGGALPMASQMSQQESRAETILPVASMYFPRRPARTAPANAEGAVRAARDVYSLAYWNWVWAKNATGSAPYRLPRQVYAHHNSNVGDGGLSDPVWDGGDGRAAGGDIGTSQELTMAHEMDHNLDRKSDPTWGAHIGGCNADDSDDTWPWPDREVHEPGFDVPNLLPVDVDEIDLMSYCRKDSAGPAKWIGEYRWQRLLNAFYDEGAASAAAAAGPAGAASADGPEDPDPPVASDVLEVSGSIERRTGQVTLEPVFRGPGIPDEDEEGDEPTGAYAVQVLGTGGRVVATRSFRASFVNVEGGLLRRKDFRADLAVSGVVREVRVTDPAGRVVARRVLSAATPSVRIVSPNGGERLPARPFDLVVDARDGDRDPLTWRVQASGDGGQTWLPVDVPVTRGRARIDPSTLPGGQESLLRVTATDGLRTVADQTDAPFSLPVTPPRPTITQPLDGARLRPGAPVVLRGSAVTSSLAELPGTNLLWYDGQQVIGEGEEARVLLRPGTHHLRLVAVDAVGEVAGSAQVSVLVDGSCAPGQPGGGGSGRDAASERGGGSRVPCGTAVPTPAQTDDDEDDDEDRDP